MRMGIHRIWTRHIAEAAQAGKGGRVLDLTGAGDIDRMTDRGHVRGFEYV